MHPTSLAICSTSLAAVALTDWAGLFSSAGPMALLVAFFVWQSWVREAHWRAERETYQARIAALEDRLLTPAE